MPQLPSGTVTFVFSDIEGSTGLLKRLGDDGYAALLADHRQLVRQAFAAHGGQEIDTQGDAFFYSFPRARAAVAAAVEVQRRHAQHDWPAGTQVNVRLGLHTGEPIVGEEGYTGLDVVRAARIAAGGRGGQILLSEATRAIVAGDLPAGVSLRELGQRRLKDIDRPEALFELVYDGSRVATDEPASNPARDLVPWLQRVTGGRGEAAKLIEERVLSEIDRALREKDEARQRRLDARARSVGSKRRPAPPAGTGSGPATATTARLTGHSRSIADEIAQLQALRQQGALTEAQYDRAVERVLGKG